MSGVGSTLAPAERRTRSAPAPEHLARHADVRRPGARMDGLAGTRRLVRLALRQDRVVLPLWATTIATLAWGVVASYRDTLPTHADRVATVRIAAGNPLARVFDGPASGADLGAMALVEGWKIMAVLTALMAAQTVVRHTRRDEEVGRAELLGSAVVGRHSRLVAALVVAGAASLGTGAAVALALGGPGRLDWAGALAAGGATAGMGVVFAAIASVGAQMFSTARGAAALASAALGGAFALRAMGDLGGTVDETGMVVRSTWLSWLSPYGWGQQLRPFHENRWWVLALFAALAAALGAVAFSLAGRRDLGAGLVAPRPGPARGGAGLRSALGLAWRLQRGILATWAVSLAVFGAAFGSIGNEVNDYLGDNEAMAQLLQQLASGGGVQDLYLVLTASFLGLGAGAYVVQALLRMRAEEVSGRVEPLLATATGRRRWLGSHVVITASGLVGSLILAGAAGGLAGAAASGDWDGAIVDEVIATAVQIPAAAALGGLVLAAFGLIPRWAGPITWSALAGALVLGQLGALFDLPQWVLNLSPYTHLPAVPAEDFSAVPVAWLVGAAVGLGALGVASFRRRDLAIGG